jgi:hypothetical protein
VTELAQRLLSELSVGRVGEFALRKSIEDMTWDNFALRHHRLFHGFFRPVRRTWRDWARLPSRRSIAG